MKTSISSALILIVFFAGGVPARAEAPPLVIVDQGRAAASLVVAANEPSAQKAAEEIQKYLEKMSGAKCPLAGEGADQPKGIVIYVGHTAAARKAGVEIPAGFDPKVRPEAFEEEGYVLKTRDRQIFIGGNADGPYQGNLYAAYAFLEKLGCRWYFPGEWGEVIPQAKTIGVPELNVTARPDFAVRRIWLSGWVPTSKAEGAQYAEWCPKIGFNQNPFYPTAGDGWLAFMLPPDEYFEKHPEFFAMGKDGKRHQALNKKTGKVFVQGTMLCLSNPEVFTEGVKNLRAALAGQRKMHCVTERGFGMSPPDGAPFCYCEKCAAANQDFDYPAYVHERMQSEEYFAFMTKLAREFPDKWVSTMAYSNREMPPQGVKLPPNLAVTYAPISCCILHPGDDPRCWRRQEMMSILRQYRQRTPHVQIYDYAPGFLQGLFIPERDGANLAVNVPLYKKVGIKGMSREGRKVFMQTWLSYYLTARLLWDAGADVAALKKDFYETFFGPDAGPHVQAWWDACEAALSQSTAHVHEDWLVNHVYTVAFTQKIRAHVTAAGQAKMTDVQRRRFEVFEQIARHLEAYAAMHEADRRMNYTQAAAEAGKMLEAKQKIAAASSFLYTFNERREKTHRFTLGHQLYYQRLADMTGGRTGRLAAPLPLEMKFARDPHNAGVVGEWYAPGFDDAKWGTRNTFFTWDQQDPPEDAAGHDWNGYGWYRGKVEIPAEFAGKPLALFLPGVINEGWVWINGEYAGHQPHQLWWHGSHEFNADIASLAKPGVNTVAIRVRNDAEVGGLYRRGFLWSPIPGSAPAPSPAPEPARAE